MYDLLVVVRHTVLSPDAWLQAGEVVLLWSWGVSSRHSIVMVIK